MAHRTCTVLVRCGFFGTNGQRTSHLAVALSHWVRYALAGAENVAFAEIIVRHEQLTGEGLEVT